MLVWRCGTPVGAVEAGAPADVHFCGVRQVCEDADVAVATAATAAAAAGAAAAAADAADAAAAARLPTTLWALTRGAYARRH